MLRLYVADGIRPLACRLAEVLAKVPSDPFTPEWIAVPSAGTRRWLTLELAASLGSGGDTGDGIVANVVRAYPGDLRTKVLAAGSEEPGPQGQAGDPWAIDRMAWTVLSVMAAGDDPELAALDAVPRGASRYARARRIADLFDRYHLYRPQMIRHWAGGRDADEAGRPLPRRLAWQPRLWRAVRERAGRPSPPELWDERLAAVRDGRIRLDLPGRLVFFGFTQLPTGGFLELAEAVAAHRQVHAFLLEPARFDPDALLRSCPPAEDGSAPLRATDETAALARHPLLRSWGRLYRETGILLAASGRRGLPPPVRVEETGRGPVTTLLARLQQGIRADAAPAPGPLPDPGDRSVQFHACFGPTRQVEVLRDVLLHLLDASLPALPGASSGEASEPLTEEDILVVCPSLEEFAPTIEAVLGPPAGIPPGPGTPEPYGSKRLRYRMADLSIRSVNPVLAATSALLELVAGRFEVTDVLDFLALAPVRQRLGLGDDDLDTVTEWAEAGKVRWGLHADQRLRAGLEVGLEANSWRSALDALLVGSTVNCSGELAVGEVAPLDVQGDSVLLAGRLADGLAALGMLADRAAAAHPVESWVGFLRQAAADLFATGRNEAWQLEALHRVLDGVQASAASAATPPPPIDLVDVTRLFSGLLDGQPGRPEYFRGGITVTSPTPLRWVPFRVVCILSMDQAGFGPTTTPGDDLLAAAPRLGDPDRRAERRQALLEAVLAAGEQLVVVRDGVDVRTNQTVPRSVVAAELFEAVNALVGPEDRDEMERRLEHTHPRQAFDDRNFTTGPAAGGGSSAPAATPWSYDSGALAGALARRQRRPVGQFLDAPLPPEPAEVIELDDLRSFLKDPAAHFLHRRLGVRVPKAPDRTPTGLPVDLDALERWGVGDRLLAARLAGRPPGDTAAMERARGVLPVGDVGRARYAEIAAVVEDLVETAVGLGVRPVPARPREIDVQLDDGTRLVGEVALRLDGDGPGPAVVTYSTLKQPARLCAWLDLVALTVAGPDRRWRSVAVGRSTRQGSDEPVSIDWEVDDEEGDRDEVATGPLRLIVECYRRGMREPLPFFPDLSAEVHAGSWSDSLWAGRRESPGAGDKPAAQMAFGGASATDIRGLSLRPGDPGFDPDGRGPLPDGSDRVTAYAHLLYGALDRSVRQRPA